MKSTAQFAGISAIVLLSILSTSRTALGEAMVSGVVTDSSGSPVANASVEALPRGDGEAGGTVGSRPNPWIRADSQGKFSINLPPGRYKIRAKDEADGYPDPVYMLNADPTARFPEVSVGERDIPDVQVMLGARGAVLEGTVRDALTHRPVAKAKITIQDVRNPGAYVEVFADKQGHFQFAVPSKALRISASANAYEELPYEEGREVTVLAGEHRSILLDLRPHEGGTK